MNFQHLKYFLMVAEELNITRAAERLYISQQALSNHISNMERELEVKLFTRSPKLALTYAGGLLVESATQILDLHSQYLRKVGDINRHYLGVLRVGISHTCGLALLPEILPRFRSEFPMAEFSLFEGNSTQLEDELSHGRVDLIICFQPIMIEGVETVPLTEQRLMMVVPKIFTNQIFGDRADAVRQQFSNGADIDACHQMPFVLIKRGNRTRNIVDQYFSWCWRRRTPLPPWLWPRRGWALPSVRSCSSGPSPPPCPPPGAGWTCSPSPTPPPSASWWRAIGRTATCRTSASASSSWPPASSSRTGAACCGPPQKPPPSVLPVYDPNRKGSNRYKP